jgi:hypothetical protein
MARSKSVEIEALDRDGCGVRAAFTLSSDHYKTTIFAVINGVSSPLLESDSVTPLQEAVHHAPADSRPALLLTGSGDGNYWSATVTPMTDIRFALLGFDFACRRGRSAPAPIVEYRFAPDVVAKPHYENGVLLRAQHREFLLRAAEMPTSLSTEHATTCRLQLSRRGVGIEPLGSPHVTTRATVQWRFEVSAIMPRD